MSERWAERYRVGAPYASPPAAGGAGLAAGAARPPRLVSLASSAEASVLQQVKGTVLKSRLAFGEEECRRGRTGVPVSGLGGVMW